MIALLQRVTEASISVDNAVVAAIGAGLLVLVGVERGDDDALAERLAERILNYRVFADAADKTNLSVRDVSGGLVLVPQFTLAADTRKGLRPSFSSAAAPVDGQVLFERLVQATRTIHPQVQTGVFGAHMQVRLINDGPVTISLRIAPVQG